jgi:hypothetical protein
LQLRRFFTDILLDQLPLLRELKRLIEELSIMAPPPPTASSLAIIEQVPEMRERIIKDANYNAIAEKQKRDVFANDEAARQRDIARLAATYSLDKFEELLPSGPSCGADGCGVSKPGEMKRCSRCRNEWYCGRACQVAHWKKHQKICDLMSKDLANKQQPATTASATPAAATAASATSSATKPAAATSAAKPTAASSSSAAKPAAQSSAAKPTSAAASSSSSSAAASPITPASIAAAAIKPTAAAPAVSSAAAPKKPLIEMLDDEDDAQNPLESPD